MDLMVVLSSISEVNLKWSLIKIKFWIYGKFKAIRYGFALLSLTIDAAVKDEQTLTGFTIARSVYITQQGL